MPRRAAQLAADDRQGAADIAAAFQATAATQLRTRIDRALRWAELQQHTLGSAGVSRLVSAHCPRFTAAADAR
jgi:hypothetical protein